MQLFFFIADFVSVLFSIKDYLRKAPIVSFLSWSTMVKVWSRFCGKMTNEVDQLEWTDLLIYRLAKNI